MAKVYVASSWRNPLQIQVVRFLIEGGHQVYDFRDDGFHWSGIDPNWKKWNPETYRSALSHPMAERGFEKDFKAMQWADVFVGVQPFGRSASMEMGWAAGQGKFTVLLLSDGEPELMVKMFHLVCCSMEEVLDGLDLWDTGMMGMEVR
jgi:nucleoside 2-deoxyribosyltransferase